MTALFGVRAIAEAVDLDPREVMAMVRAGQGARLVGMVNRRQKPRVPVEWEDFASSIEEISFDVDWEDFRRSIDTIT